MASLQSESEDLFDEDEEIIEIFVEEAEEVLEVIDTHLPLWINDNGDENSLMELRRAFHTLKGSGRMVRASQIADLAWAVESMLNHLISGRAKTSQSMYDLIHNVMLVIPQLVEVFKKRQAAALIGVDFELLIRQAEMLAKGETIEVITTTQSISKTASENIGDQGADSQSDHQGLPNTHEINYQKDVGKISNRVDVLSAGVDDILINLDRMTANMVKMETSVDIVKKRRADDFSKSKAEDSSKAELRQLTSQVSASVRNIDEIKSSMEGVRRSVEHDLAAINSSVVLRDKNNSKRVEAVCAELSREIELSKAAMKELQGAIIAWSLGSATVASMVVGASLFFMLS